MDIISLIRLVFELYSFILLARVLTSWFPVDPDSPIIRLLYQATEPVLAPIRRMLPASSGMDFSPIVAFIGLIVVEQLIITLLRTLLR